MVKQLESSPMNVTSTPFHRKLSFTAESATVTVIPNMGSPSKEKQLQKDANQLNHDQ